MAKVNGKDIGRDVFNKQMDRTRQRFQQAKREIPPALEVRLKENILRKLVDDELISQKAAAESVALTDAEVEAKLGEHKARFGSPEAFKNFLERTSQTEEDLRDELKRTELRDRLFNKLAGVDEPTDDEVKDTYEKNKDRYKDRESVNALQVFWKVDATEAADKKKAAQASAAKAFKELNKKGADFKALTQKYTDATPTPNGGDMGWFTRGRQVKQIEDVVFAEKVKAGDVLGPVESPFGLHIIKVVEKKAEKQRTLEEVTPAIKTTIKARKKSEKTREVLANLKKDAKVEVLEAGVSLEPAPVMQAPGAPGAPGSPIQLQAVPGNGTLPPGHPAPGAPAPAPGAPAPAPAGQPH